MANSRRPTPSHRNRGQLIARCWLRLQPFVKRKKTIWIFFSKKNSEKKLLHRLKITFIVWMVEKVPRTKNNLGRDRSPILRVLPLVWPMLSPWPPRTSYRTSKLCFEHRIKKQLNNKNRKNIFGYFCVRADVGTPVAIACKRGRLLGKAR